jgi:hypothetical protein
MTALLLAAVLAARVYRGLHFPVDVAGGLLIGALGIFLLPRSGSSVVRNTLALIQDAESRWPRLTACGLFVVAYGYASMFDDFRFLLYVVMRAVARS